jgi:hypothetical protein
MDVAEEFRTVDLLKESTAETRGVDAFALALIKAERQLRRLVTHLIFQYPCFAPHDVGALRYALSKNRHVYLDGFERGFNAIYRRSIQELIGTEYDRLREQLRIAIKHRNKIFHGQLTLDCLSRDELFEFVSEIRLWCSKLAYCAISEFGYDGFGRDSFQKSVIPDLATRFRRQFNGIQDYAEFIKRIMQRE